MNKAEAEVVVGRMSLPDDIASVIMRVLAQVRHEARVDATMDAATSAAAGLAPGARPEELRGVARFLTDLDLAGHGGPFGMGGPEGRTTRMPWAVALGSGRWQARDGGAYRAAAEAAVVRLEGGAVVWWPTWGTVLKHTVPESWAPWVLAEAHRVAALAALRLAGASTEMVPDWAGVIRRQGWRLEALPSAVEMAEQAAFLWTAAATAKAAEAATA